MSLQAERIRCSIAYLSTTFALTDAELRRALVDFLQDEEQGAFIGPSARLPLPAPLAKRAGARCHFRR